MQGLIDIFSENRDIGSEHFLLSIHLVSVVISVCATITRAQSSKCPQDAKQPCVPFPSWGQQAFWELAFSLPHGSGGFASHPHYSMHLLCPAGFSQLWALPWPCTLIRITHQGYSHPTAASGLNLILLQPKWSQNASPALLAFLGPDAAKLLPWPRIPGSLTDTREFAPLMCSSACNTGDPGSIPGPGRFPGEGIGYPLQYSWASLVAHLVKNLNAMWETWVWSLGWEDPLEQEMATYSNILA